jgi:hypothetical protein
MFKELKLEDMPPHIYAVANNAFRTMLRTRCLSIRYLETVTSQNGR